MRIINTDILKLINRERFKAGLKPLSYRKDIQDATNIRAKEASILWSHSRPDGTPYYSADDKIYGENLAKGYKTPPEIVMAWMKSKSHRENILSPLYKGVCIGEYISDKGKKFTSSEFTL